MKKFVFIFVACFISLAAFADSACSDSLCVIQPNGDTLWTYLRGRLTIRLVSDSSIIQRPYPRFW